MPRKITEARKKKALNLARALRRKAGIEADQWVPYEFFTMECHKLLGSEYEFSLMCEEEFKRKFFGVPGLFGFTLPWNARYRSGRYSVVIYRPEYSRDFPHSNDDHYRISKWAMAHEMGHVLFEHGESIHFSSGQLQIVGRDSSFAYPASSVSPRALIGQNKSISDRDKQQQMWEWEKEANLFAFHFLADTRTLSQESTNSSVRFQCVSEWANYYHLPEIVVMHIWDGFLDPDRFYRPAA